MGRWLIISSPFFLSQLVEGLSTRESEMIVIHIDICYIIELKTHTSIYIKTNSYTSDIEMIWNIFIHTKDSCTFAVCNYIAFFCSNNAILR